MINVCHKMEMLGDLCAACDAMQLKLKTAEIYIPTLTDHHSSYNLYLYFDNNFDYNCNICCTISN